MRVLMLAVTMWVAVSASQAGEISTRFSAADDLSAYATFSFGEGTPARREHVQSGILAAIERELTGHGLLKTEGRSDLLVLTYALAGRQTLSGLSDEEYFDFVSGVTSVDAWDLGVGTLVIDIVDRNTDRIVWRGVASDTVKGSMAKAKKKMDKLMTRLFRNWGHS